MRPKLIQFITFSFLFCVFSLELIAQKQGKALIDSLQKEIKEYKSPCNTPCIKDSSKVILLLDLAWEYHFNTPDAVLPLCKEAIVFSQKINYTEGIAQSYHIMGIFYKEQDDYTNALKFFTEEISVLDTLLSSQKKSKILLSKKAACFNSLANLYKLKGDDIKAIDNYYNALKVNEEYNNEDGVAINNSNIGDLYYNRGEYPTSLKYYYKALQLADKLGRERTIAAILGRIGRIYRTQKELDKAFDFYTRAIAINTKLNDKNGMAINYQSIALIYRESNNTNKTLEYNNVALKLFTEMKDKKGIASINNNIGTTYKDKAELFEKNEQRDSARSNYLLALNYFLQANKSQKEIARNTNMADYFLNIGATYVALDRNEEAENNLMQSLVLADSLNYLEGVQLANEGLSDFYLKTGNPGKAITYYKKSIVAKDSLFNEFELQDITRSEMKYEADKKEAITKAEYEKQKAISEYEKITAITEADKKRLLAEAEKRLQVSEADRKRLEAETENQKLSQVMSQKEINAQFERKEAAQKVALANAETQLQKQKALRYSVIGGAAVLLLAAIFGFFYYKRNAEQKQKETSLNLQVSETEMKALRSQMNPHFIFNALQSIQTFLMTHKPDDANSYLLKFSRLMRLVLENSQHSEVPLKDDMQALELYMQLESIRLKYPFTYQFHIEDGIDIEETSLPPLILQPFVENAIWHGLQYKPGPGHIDIIISKKGDTLHATVEDNGVGRDMSKKVAQPMLLKKESLGMKLTEERLKILNEIKNIKAQFKITDLFTKNNHPAGTKVELSLPLSG